MRIPTLAALRASKVYLSLASLAAMPVFRQQRFLEVFNKIWALTTARGASPDVADASAAAIAILSAQAYTPTPAIAHIEAEEHYFSTMAEFQFSRGGVLEINDFSFLNSNFDLINAAVAGDAFNLNHDHIEPTGVIRRLVKPADAPESVRAKFPDAPFFTVASYYEDTPQSIRDIETVSAEWSQMKAAADGSRTVVIPQTFALTKNPATHRLLGVGKAALLNDDAKSFEGGDAVEGLRDTMPTALEELQAKFASLQKEADASKDSATTLKALQTKHASLETEHSDLVKKVAALGGLPAAEGEKAPSQDKALEGLKSKMASFEADIADMKKAASQKEADLWAEKVVKGKEIPLDAKPKLATLYLTAKQSALDLEASLPSRIVKPGESQAHLNIEVLDDKQAEARTEFLKGAF